MEIYIKRKRRLGDKYGKSFSVKLFNDEVETESNNDKYVNQVADITDEEG